MSGANFDLCSITVTPSLAIMECLKRDSSFAGPKGGHLIRIAEIRCSKDEAKALHDFAKLINPEAAGEIEKSIDEPVRL